MSTKACLDELCQKELALACRQQALADLSTLGQGQGVGVRPRQVIAKR